MISLEDRWKTRTYDEINQFTELMQFVLYLKHFVNYDLNKKYEFEEMGNIVTDYIDKKLMDTSAKLLEEFELEGYKE